MTTQQLPSPIDASSRPLRRLTSAAIVLAAMLAMSGFTTAWEQPVVALDGSVGALDAPASALAPAVRGERARRAFPAPPDGKLIFPVDAASDCSVFWSSFGAARDGGTRQHEGTDIMGSKGRAVYAIANGELIQRYTNTGSAGYGWTLKDPVSGTIYRYFHLTGDAAGRVVGEQVVVGDVIGYVGDTGTTAGNFHLHLEVRPNNVAVNPVGLLDIPSPPCRVLP